MKLNKKILTTRDLCKALGVTRHAVLYWRKKRGLPWHSRKILGHFGAVRVVCFRRADVLRWLKQNPIKIAGRPPCKESN